MIIRRNMAEGQVYFMNDPLQFGTYNDITRHPYLIISINGKGIKTDNCLGHIQVMAISSLAKFDKQSLKFEIPIISYDNTIRYIIPYNIYSIDNSLISTMHFCGNIVNTEFATQNEFLNFLIEIYLFVNNLSNIDEEYLMDKMDRYKKMVYDYYDKWIAPQQNQSLVQENNTGLIEKDIAIVKEPDNKFNNRKKIKDKYKNKKRKGNRHNAVIIDKNTKVPADDNQVNNDECNELTASSFDMLVVRNRHTNSYSDNELLDIVRYVNTFGVVKAAEEYNMSKGNFKRKLKHIYAEIDKRNIIL